MAADAVSADKAAAEAYMSPFPFSGNVESRMAWRIVRRAAFVGPVVVAGGWLWRGPIGAWSALAGVLIVLANFLLSGWILSKAATISMQAYHVAAMAGFFVRLGFIAGSMFAVAWLFDVDRMSLGIAAIVTVFALLILESLATLSGARKDVEWS